VIRRELCDEAIRLARVLVEHPIGAVPETDALLALMYLHASRFDARFDSVGGLLLMKEQDARDGSIAHRRGCLVLRRSARGDQFSRYHVELRSRSSTVWLRPTRKRLGRDRAALSALDRVVPSPLNRLNRAIAIAEWKALKQESLRSRAASLRLGFSVITYGRDLERALTVELVIPRGRSRISCVRSTLHRHSRKEDFSSGGGASSSMNVSQLESLTNTSERGGGSTE